MGKITAYFQGISFIAPKPAARETAELVKAAWQCVLTHNFPQFNQAMSKLRAQSPSSSSAAAAYSTIIVRILGGTHKFRNILGAVDLEPNALLAITIREQDFDNYVNSNLLLPATGVNESPYSPSA